MSKLPEFGKFTKIKGVQVYIEAWSDEVIIDCARQSDTGEIEMTGPRFLLLRGKDALGNSGWKLLVHPDKDDLSHCVFITDRTQIPQVMEAGAESQMWPETI